VITWCPTWSGSAASGSESLATGESNRDRGIKRERYSNYGVPHYWIVDPRQRHVEVYRMLENPVTPHAVARESFTWIPVVGGPTLEVDVPDLFSGLDELTREHV